MTKIGRVHSPWIGGDRPARSSTVERPAYQALEDQEHFIVSLLKDRIESYLQQYACAPRDGARVLDVGCGRQPFATFMEGLGYRYLGLDVRQNPEGTVAFICAIDEELSPDLAGEQFDLIVCLEVLEHVADWHQAFSNLATLLAPGGGLLLTCPSFYPLHEEPYDFWRPTPHAIARFAVAAGLVPRNIETAGGAWEVMGTALTLAVPGAANSGLASRLAANVIERCRHLAFRAVRSGWPQRLVDLEGPLYLSNIAWLEKPVEKQHQ